MRPHSRRADVSLRDKYNHAIQTAKQLKFQGSADERDGKLHFHGTVNSQEDANQIWNALKTVPAWQKDVVEDIKGSAPAANQQPTGSTAGAATPASGHETYTV